jgi:hypothetical protein
MGERLESKYVEGQAAFHKKHMLSHSELEQIHPNVPKMMWGLRKYGMQFQELEVNGEKAWEFVGLDPRFRQR